MVHFIASELFTYFTKAKKSLSYKRREILPSGGKGCLEKNEKLFK